MQIKSILFLSILSLCSIYSADSFQTIDFRDTKTVDRWLKSYPDKEIINDQNQTPLIAAVRSGNYKLVKKLVKKSRTINHVDNQGFTALDWAIYLGDLDTMLLLTRKKAEPNKSEYIEIVNSIKIVQKKALIWGTINNVLCGGIVAGMLILLA